MWVGNWGDEERTRELQEFLIKPAAALRDRTVAVHGVRYPEHAQKAIVGGRHRVPGIFAESGAPEDLCAQRAVVACSAQVLRERIERNADYPHV